MYVLWSNFLFSSVCDAVFVVVFRFIVSIPMILFALALVLARSLARAFFVVYLIGTEELIFNNEQGKMIVHNFFFDMPYV